MTIADPPDADTSTTRLAPNVAGALAYLAGPLSALPLMLVERRSAFVRFHACQSLIACVLLWVTWMVLIRLPVVGWFLALVLAPPLLFLLWLALLVKAYLGERWVLPVAGRLAERLHRGLGGLGD